MRLYTTVQRMMMAWIYECVYIFSARHISWASHILMESVYTSLKYFVAKHTSYRLFVKSMMDRLDVHRMKLTLHGRIFISFSFSIFFLPFSILRQFYSFIFLLNITTQIPIKTKVAFIVYKYEDA